MQRLKLKLSERSCLIVVSTIVAALVLPYFDHVPMWDGAWYYDCVYRAATSPLSLSALSCAHHSSHAYLLLLSTLQRLLPGTIALIHLADLLLFLSSVWSFHHILLTVFDAPEHKDERILLTLNYAILPACVANVMHLNLDLPVLVGMIWGVDALLSRRYFLAAASGIWMSFSKDSGIVLYLIVVAVLLLTSSGCRASLSVRRLLMLGAPIVLYGLYLLCPSLAIPDGKLRWSNEKILSSLLRILFDMDPRSSTMSAYLFDVFILNFNWVYTISLFIGALCAAARVFRESRANAPASRASTIWLVLGLFVLSLYASTRLRPFNNVRYLLPVFPWLVISSGIALRACIRQKKLRELILTAMAWCLLSASYTTWDPVSRSLAGTFAVGRRDFLKMQQLHSPGGLELDSLVYNLQYLELDRLYREAVRLVWTSGGSSIGQPSCYRYPGWIDKISGLRTAKLNAATLLGCIRDASQFGEPNPPPSFYFVDFPNLPRGHFLLQLTGIYENVRTWKLERLGYSINVYRFSEPRQIPGRPDYDRISLNPISPIYFGSLKATTGWQELGLLQLNRSFGRDTLRMNGKVYSSGLGTHAFSRIRLEFDSRYSSFTGACGVDEETKGRGSVVCRVRNGGKVLYESGRISGNQPPATFEVAVHGLSDLMLEVDDAGDGKFWDHADWVDLNLK